MKKLAKQKILDIVRLHCMEITMQLVFMKVVSEEILSALPVKAQLINERKMP